MSEQMGATSQITLGRHEPRIAAYRPVIKPRFILEGCLGDFSKEESCVIHPMTRELSRAWEGLYLTRHGSCMAVFYDNKNSGYLRTLIQKAVLSADAPGVVRRLEV
jgi:hypothetical protein